MSIVNDGAFEPTPLAGAAAGSPPVTIPIAAEALREKRAVSRLRRDSSGMPAIVAHRGASALAPENTLAAIRLALALGADAVECDVCLSADGVPVLMHDETLLRTAGIDARVDALTLKQLAQLDVGNWKSPQYAGERIPTLAEALLLLGGEIPLLVELKQSGMETEVVAAIEAAGAKRDDAVLYTHHLDGTRRLNELNPELLTALVVEDVPAHQTAWNDLVSTARAAGADGLAVDLEHTTPERVAAARRAGLWIHVWTVNTPEQMRRIAAAAVDAITTDYPDVAKRVLATDVDLTAV